METLKINQEMNITSVVSALDAMFYSWLGGPVASDDLSSQKERQEIGWQYRQIRKLLAESN